MKEKNNNQAVYSKTLLDVKKLIKIAKNKNLVKKHTEAFAKNPVELEKHQGKCNYFCS